VQKKLESPPRTNLDNTSLNPLKLFPGISFSMMFRFLWVSRIYRRRMALFCGKKYDLELNLVLILLAASESHLQQGILAGSLGINKNAMVFLIDNLEIRRLIKRVANPDNRREKIIECTPEGRRIVAEIKTNYPEIVRWGLYPLTDAQIEQFGMLLAQIIEGESSAKPPLPLADAKKSKHVTTPSVRT
jgi:DNA-binding MarR family transcriptional regulator